MEPFRYVQQTILTLVLITAGMSPVYAGQPSAKPASDSCISTDWPWSRSDLKPDPTLIVGTLPNGFRYILKENHEPKNRVAVYLDIQAGSLNESEDQRGYAHFLEHMLFNGSTHFKPGELVEYFQSIGMSFGGDTNARTSFDETVYNIILPGGDRGQLQKGLVVMADYARGALLLESEIERERGVILSEKRSRDSADYRTYVAGSEFSLRGTLMPERMPIGVDETLKKADHRLLKQYYDEWYRPENMILVVVGDFKKTDIEPLVHDTFRGLSAGTEMPGCPDFGSLSHNGLEIFYHHEEELGRSEISIESLWNKEKVNDSVSLQASELYEYAVVRMLQHRLQRLQEKLDTPFTGVNYVSGDMFDKIGYASISAQARPGKWRESLKILEHSLRQALLYGFTEDELRRTKKEIAAQLEEAVLTASSKDSKEIANDIIRHLNDNRVLMSAAQEKDLYMPLLQRMDLATVNRSLQETWAHDNRLVSLTGNTALPKNSAVDEIRNAYEEAASEKIAAQTEKAGSVFPYLQIPAPGKIEAVIPFQKIGAERLVFANGVTVNLKRTEFQKNEVLTEIHIGEGKLREPRPGLSLLTAGVVNGSGSARLTRSEFEEVLAGTTIDTQFKVDESSFVWSGKAVKTETEKLFQVLHTLIADPGLRPDVFDRVKRDTRQAYQGLERDVNGAMQFQVQPFLAGNDRRFGLPPWSAIDKLSLDEIRQWLLPELAKGEFEVSVVGDFDRDEVVKLAGRYFGSLQQRGVRTGQVKAVDFPTGKTLKVNVNSSIDKAIVLLAWPTDDFWDIHRTRRLHMLAAIFDDRLRKVIREKLGATYSPEVFSSGSRIYPHYGMLVVQMVVEPGREKVICDEVLKIAEDLRGKGVTEEELERAKAPMMTSLKDAVRSNAYWLSSVLTESSKHPQQLGWPLSILGDFEKVTAREMNILAGRYLKNERVATAWVVPATVAGEKK
jgi:zinc protease